MKKILWISLGILILLSVYLNRSYSYIYDKIETMGLSSSITQKTYVLGSPNMSSQKLIYVPIGDSLTAGVGVESYEQSYPYQFAQKLIKNNTQINLQPQAFPGARSKDILQTMLTDAIKIQPDIITLLIGVNDVHGNISKKDFADNYEIILQRLTQETRAHIYVLNIPYIGAPHLILPPYNYYFDTRIQDFNTVIKDLSSKYKVSYIDLYTPTLKPSQEDSYYASDLFHPSSLGYTRWAQIIYDNLNQ